MNRTITSKEIQKLFEFCREQKVEHYDLQVELVDHLASLMEEQWEKQPGLSFDTAMYSAFKKFGYKGFREIYETKKKELNKKYVQIHLQYFYRFFRWPQILLTALLTFSVFQLVIFTENLKNVYFVFLGFAVFISAFFYFFWYPKKLKIDIKDNTRFLLLEVLKLRYQNFLLVLFVPLNVLNIVLLDIFDRSEWQTLSFEDPLNLLIIGALSFLMVCFGILFYGFSIHASLKIKQHFTEQFPEFIK